MTYVHLDYELLGEIELMMEADFPDLVETFLSGSRRMIHLMPELLASGDIKAFILNIHSLKGSCKNMGANYLAQLCNEGEALAKAGTMELLDPQLCSIAAEFELLCETLARYERFNPTGS